VTGLLLGTDDAREAAVENADMRETDKLFEGSIPETYDRFLGPLLSEPYARDLAARLAALAPARVLETAAGTGVVTRALARTLPEGTRSSPPISASRCSNTTLPPSAPLSVPAARRLAAEERDGWDVG
jgi:hypothetical protein